jgi:hypothetical protein
VIYDGAGGSPYFPLNPALVNQLSKRKQGNHDLTDGFPLKF